MPSSLLRLLIIVFALLALSHTVGAQEPGSADAPRGISTTTDGFFLELDAYELGDLADELGIDLMVGGKGRVRFITGIAEYGRFEIRDLDLRGRFDLLFTADWNDVGPTVILSTAQGDDIAIDFEAGTGDAYAFGNFTKIWSDTGWLGGDEINEVRLEFGGEAAKLFINERYFGTARIDPDAAYTTLVIDNIGTDDALHSLEVVSAPVHRPARAANGLKVDRTVVSLDLNAYDLGDLAQDLGVDLAVGGEPRARLLTGISDQGVLAVENLYLSGAFELTLIADWNEGGPTLVLSTADGEALVTEFSMGRDDEIGFGQISKPWQDTGWLGGTELNEIRIVVEGNTAKLFINEEVFAPARVNPTAIYTQLSLKGIDTDDSLHHLQIIAHEAQDIVRDPLVVREAFIRLLLEDPSTGKITTRDLQIGDVETLGDDMLVTALDLTASNLRPAPAPAQQDEWYALARPVPYPFLLSEQPTDPAAVRWLVLTNARDQPQVAAWQEIVIGPDDNESILSERAVDATLHDYASVVEALTRWYDTQRDEVMWVDQRLTNVNSKWDLTIYLGEAGESVENVPYAQGDCDLKAESCAMVNVHTGDRITLPIVHEPVELLALEEYDDTAGVPQCDLSTGECFDAFPYVFRCDLSRRTCLYQHQYSDEKIEFSLRDAVPEWPIDLAGNLNIDSFVDYTMVCNIEAEVCMSLHGYHDFACSAATRTCTLSKPQGDAGIEFELLYEPADWVEPIITYRNGYQVRNRALGSWITCNVEERICLDELPYTFTCNFPISCQYQHRYTAEQAKLSLVYEPVEWPPASVVTLETVIETADGGARLREFPCNLDAGQCFDQEPFIYPVQCDFGAGVCRVPHRYTDEVIEFEVVKELSPALQRDMVRIDASDVEILNDEGLDKLLPDGTFFLGLNCSLSALQCAPIPGVPTAGGDFVSFVCTEWLKCDLKPESFACRLRACE